MIMNEEIIYHWVVNPDDRMKLNDCADEYKIVKEPKAINGIVLYGKFNGTWKPNPFQTRFVIGHLLERNITVSKVLAECIEGRKKAIQNLDNPNAEKDNYRCYWEGVRDTFQKIRVFILDS